MSKTISETLTDIGFTLADNSAYGSTYHATGNECEIYVTMITAGGFEVVKQPHDEDVPATVVKYNKSDETIEAVVKKWITQ
jgi:hypothetical protein